MKHPDNIKLPNLALFQKIIWSVLILSGLALYLETWNLILQMVYSAGADVGDSLGVRLGIIASEHASDYHTLLFWHTASMLVVVLASYRLFLLTSLRRRVRSLIAVAAFALILIDSGSWLYAPSCSSSNMYVGFAGALTGVPIIALALIPLFQMWVYRRWRNAPTGQKKVVIVGGGFAGLYAALGLNRKLGYHSQLEITVVDRKNYFLFPPLLPSAAAGTIETREVSYPFRRIFETTNIQFRKIDITKIDPKARQIVGSVEMNETLDGTIMTREGQLDYDYLVLAPGSDTQTFNTPGANEYAFFMRELNDAVILRNHVIDCFERAAVVRSMDDQRELLTFAIVGAGPTGIETATEIYDLIHGVLLKRYPEIERGVPKVCIIQSGNQVLPGWDPTVVAIAQKQLAKLNIELILEARVTRVTPNSVAMKSGTEIPTRTVIWCAGVKPSPLLTKCDLPLDKSGRITVEPDLRVAGFDNIFVLGDAAHFVDPKQGKALPPLGQVAFQQGAATAKNLVRLLENKPTAAFQYFDFGSLVSVGEHFAAVNLMGIKLSGFIGWFVWRSLYLAKLVGVSNKIRVVIDWTLDLLIERSISQINDEGSRRKKITERTIESPTPLDRRTAITLAPKRSEAT